MHKGQMRLGQGQTTLHSSSLRGWQHMRAGLDGLPVSRGDVRIVTWCDVV